MLKRGETRVKGVDTQVPACVEGASIIAQHRKGGTAANSEGREMATYDRKTEDTGNVVSLDHVNVQVADQQQATLFYIVGLGFTRDPYLTIGLENMWLNAGRQQFHVPTRPTAPQVVRGTTGIVVPDLDDLEQRLTEVKPQLEGTRFAYARENGRLDVTCPWGNKFACTGPVDGFRATFGIPYVQFNVPAGAAKGIASFYSTVLGAFSSVSERDGAPAATVQAGPDQVMIFREDASESPPYDGHHIAIYIADFSGPHATLESRGLVSEESNEHQYRFRDIVDLETGKVLFELEHEVRSMRHPMFGRELVNRDPSINARNYTRRAEYLNVG